MENPHSNRSISDEHLDCMIRLAYRRERERILDKILSDLSLSEDENVSFDVPEGWQGEYYPTYIPEGLDMYSCEGDLGYVDFVDSSGCLTVFMAGDHSHTTLIDIEDCTWTFFEFQQGYSVLLLFIWSVAKFP